MDKKFDFSGWATKANVLCSDGRTILKDAFKHQDGAKVPLVWNHQHNRPEEVLGHAILKNMEDGVYAYCSFNDTEAGQAAKLCVQHGDINALSIWANGLRHQGANVIHGMIREVSLVLAGANPSAFIDSVMSHGDGAEEEGYIYTGEFIENVEPLFHSEPEMTEEEVEEVEEAAEEVEAEVAEEVEAEVSEEISENSESLSHADTEKKGESEMAEETKKVEAVEEKKEESQKTVKEVFETLNDEQQKAVYYVIARMKEDLAKGDEDKKDEEVKHSEGGTDEMKHNAFENKTNQEVMSDVLSHSEMNEIFTEAQRCGSLKEAVLAHGITDIELLFPDNKALNAEPEFVKRNDDWVAKVLGGVHHTPFSRIKSIFADITAAEARAKGYQKGKIKIEEVFKLLKRTTNPTTVYKKQKLDRDDMLDITDFNVIPWLKKEIRMMLNEEIARAIIIGDGRDPVEDADDKIDEECIRPIWKMEDLFTVKVPVAMAASATEEERAAAFIKACVKSRKDYKGSGSPVMFMPEALLTECLLLEDKNGRVIYETEDKLKTRLRVSEIIPVPVMEGDAIKRADKEGKHFELAGLYVNLKDYNVGTDKGGEIGFFEDFDLDYNQHKYLMETRCSGSLIKPHSAVAIEFTTAQ